jgi:pyrroline-5-carboxylate reductase
MASEPNILLAGCGKMGTALLQGWIKNFPGLGITVIEPNEVPHLPQVNHLISAELLPPSFSPAIAVLAVKPQIMKEACGFIKSRLAAEVPVLSIAAGKPLSFYEEIFGPSRPVIRAMPNTPAAIGHGISVLCANAEVTPEHKHLATGLLEAVGHVSWIEDERLMDAVTAVSGSGPAYVFLLIEELAKAGVSAGLPETLAMNLARQTVIGSAYLAEAEKDTPVSTLRQNVTSPGGTTEAALNILMGDDGFRKILDEAVSAAVARGKELAG